MKKAAAIFGYVVFTVLLSEGQLFGADSAASELQEQYFEGEYETLRSLKSSSHPVKAYYGVKAELALLRAELECMKAVYAASQGFKSRSAILAADCSRRQGESSMAEGYTGKAESLADSIKVSAQAAAALKKAFELKKNGEYLAAVASFNEMLEEAPEHPSALKGKKECIIELGRDRKLGKAGIALKKGSTYFKQKKYVIARTYLNEALSLNPKSEAEVNPMLKKIKAVLDEEVEKASFLSLAEAAWTSGADFLKQQRYKKARESLLEGKGYAPDLKPWDKQIALVNDLEVRAAQRSRSGRIKEMNENSRKGIAALAAEKLQLAVTYLATAVKLAEELKLDEEIKKNKLHLKNAREYLEKKEKEEVNENSPFFSLVSTLIDQGQAYYDRGDYQKAAREYEKVRRLFPKNREANQRIILCQLKMNPKNAGKQLAALMKLGEELMKNQDYASARLNFNIVRNVDSEYPSVQKLYKKADDFVKGNLVRKKISKGEADAMYNNAFAMYRQGKNKESLAVVRKLLDGYPDHYNGNNLNNRLLLALKFTLKRPKPTPPEAVKFYTSGLRYYTSGQLKLARQSFQKALNIHPGYTRARKALQRIERQLQQI